MAPTLISDIPCGVSYKLEAIEGVERMLRDSSLNDKSPTSVHAKLLTLVTPEEALYNNSSRHGSTHHVGVLLRSRISITQGKFEIPRAVDVLPKIDFEGEKPGMILQFSWKPQLSVTLASAYRMRMYVKHLQLSTEDFFGMSLDATGEV